MNILLDDDPIRTPENIFKYTRRDIYIKKYWHVVRSYNDFIKMIESNYKATGKLPDIISFDHDLADVHYDSKTWTTSVGTQENEKTGYDCAKWLIEFMMDNNIKQLPVCYVHSMNSVGATNIKNYLDNYQKSIEVKNGED